MTTVLRKIVDTWYFISDLGTENQNYSEYRKIVLSNQIAVIGFFVMLAYDAFYLAYDAALLIGPIVTNLVGAMVCIVVLHMNRLKHHDAAKVLIYVTPNIQIYLLTYFLGTATGMHLLHFMMISYGLFFFSHVRKINLILIGIFPIIMFFLEHFLFRPELTPIELNYAATEFLFITLSSTTFGLLAVFFYLFYTAILKTEDLLNREYQRSEALLLNILPGKIADRLKNENRTIADFYPAVTILFADLVGFTGLASKLVPEELVNKLNLLFQKFDELIERYGLEKIKTIGDAYMVAGGIPEPDERHVEKVATLALEMRQIVEDYQIAGNTLNLRIGFHTGPAVAGIIGLKKFSYDVWGDTVNIASRLESNGIPCKIHVSERCYQLLNDKFTFKERGTIELKGLGKARTYFLINKK